MATPPWHAVHGLGAGVWVGRARYAMRVGLLRKLAYAGQACGAGSTPARVLVLLLLLLLLLLLIASRLHTVR